MFLLFFAMIVMVAIVKPTMPTDREEITPSPLPGAISFFYSETDPATATTWIRQSTTADVNTSVEIAVFDHAADTLPTGSLSPDGAQIALLIAEEEDGGDSAQSLWLLRTDGSYFQRASEKPCSWFTWRQDSQALALFNQTTPEQGYPSKIRIDKLNLASQETTLIMEESTELDVKPLGWASGGEEFVFMSLSSGGNWSVFSIKIESGVRIERFNLPDTDLLRNAWLSPSGTFILMDVIRNDQARLLLSSLDGGQQAEIASVGIGLFTIPPPFTAVWSPDGQRILINQLTTDHSGTTWKTYELKGVPGKPIDLGVVDPNHYLRPLAWSPDGEWLVMAELPFPFARLYIKQIDANDRLGLSLEKRSNQAGWLGWSPIK
jgi:Tol biopolymer transport system component